MECPVCGSSHKRFWCTRCLSDRLHAHRGVQTATSAECKSLAQQITAVLEPARPPTGISRSVEMASLKVRLSSLQDDISDSRRRVQLAKDELSAAKALMATRRREYTESRQMVESERMRGIERAVRERNDAQKSYLQTADVLMQSRRLLIRELLSIFRLRKVQRRLSKPPALGSVGACIPSGASAHVGARQTVTAISPTGPAHADPIEYRIVNVPSPVFGYALNCPRERFNAAIGHIIHMCAVLGKYLDIDFPFKVVNKGTKSCAYRNSAFAIEITRMPLYLTDSNAEHFTIGLAMLNYNIAYLCYTQGVDIPLLNVTNTLENIALCCQAMNLGRDGSLPLSILSEHSLEAKSSMSNIQGSVETPCSSTHRSSQPSPSSSHSSSVPHPHRRPLTQFPLPFSKTVQLHCVLHRRKHAVAALAKLQRAAVAQLSGDTNVAGPGAPQEGQSPTTTTDPSRATSPSRRTSTVSISASTASLTTRSPVASPTRGPSRAAPLPPPSPRRSTTAAAPLAESRQQQQQNPAAPTDRLTTLILQHILTPTSTSPASPDDDDLDGAADMTDYLDTALFSPLLEVPDDEYAAEWPWSAGEDGEDEVEDGGEGDGWHLVKEVVKRGSEVQG